MKDVDEEILQDFAHSYFIAQGEDGCCRHLEVAAGGYSIHEDHPCRAYDCRQDKRIWSDFEQRIVSPDLESLFVSGKSNNGSEESGS